MYAIDPGVYFAMLTLAFAQLPLVTSFFSGMSLPVVMMEWSTSGQQNGSQISASYYYLTLILGVGGILFLRHVAHSPFGYALRASRDSSRQALKQQVSTPNRFNGLPFAFAGAMAGLAGGLFVFSKGSIFPTELEIARSFDALIVVFLGGV